MSPKHVVFDVVGTVVSFEAFYERVHAVLGERLLARNMTAQHFGFTWKNAAELDFTFLSMSGHYTPFSDVMRNYFYRSLFFAGIEDPRSFATEAERDECMDAYLLLQMRPGAKEAVAALREAGFTVWCFTSGDVGRVRGYWQRAGVEMPLENFVSCDTKGVAKPEIGAYQDVLSKLGEGEKWFAAAHMWDVAAAVRAGFKGAYCTVYEKEPLEEMFGAKMEVIADSLPEMAKGLIAKSN